MAKRITVKKKATKKKATKKKATKNTTAISAGCCMASVVKPK